MSYLFKQKFAISDLAPLEQKAVRVLLYEPEGDLAALYRHYLNCHNFDIKHCPDLALVREWINRFRPDLLLFSSDSKASFAAVKGIFSSFPRLKIVTTGYNINNADLSRLMSYGVLSHFNRRFTRPADLPALIKSIIK